MGTYTRQGGLSTELINNSTGTVVTESTSQGLAFAMNYTIVRANYYRTGTLLVSSNTGSGNPTYSDDYVQNGDAGVTLTVTQAGSTITVSYATNNSPAVNGIINYSINYLA